MEKKTNKVLGNAKSGNAESEKSRKVSLESIQFGQKFRIGSAKPKKADNFEPLETDVSAKETSNRLDDEKPAPKKEVRKPRTEPYQTSVSSKQNMVIKFIFGIIVLAAFVVFAYISISVAPHTSDITDDYNSGVNYHRGIEYEETGSVQSIKTESISSTAEESVIAEVSPTEEVSVVEESETVEPTATPDERPEVAKAAALGLPAPPEIDITSWEYLLVNNDHTIGEDFRPETFAALNLTMDETDIQETTDDNSETRCLVDSRIGEALRDFALACKEAGNPVYLSSGYRSYSTQSYLFQRKVSQGYTEDVARTIVAYPGTSEHQTGLCCDITDYYRETKDSSLADTDTYKWLCENCTDYGFVVRYPEDKSGSADSITGIIYEPWHFRYVGKEAAKYMTDNNLCLEEFVALYE